MTRSEAVSYQAELRKSLPSGWSAEDEAAVAKAGCANNGNYTEGKPKTLSQLISENSMIIERTKSLTSAAAVKPASAPAPVVRSGASTPSDAISAMKPGRGKLAAMYDAKYAPKALAAAATQAARLRAETRCSTYRVTAEDRAAAKNDGKTTTITDHSSAALKPGASKLEAIYEQKYGKGRK